MTRKSAKDAKCDLCGNVDELRPYGPNGENICYECGMKNGAVTIQQIFRVKHGDKITLAQAQAVDDVIKLLEKLQQRPI